MGVEGEQASRTVTNTNRRRAVLRQSGGGGGSSQQRNATDGADVVFRDTASEAGRSLQSNNHWRATAGRVLTANYTCFLLACHWRLTRPPPSPPVTAKTSRKHQCQCDRAMKLPIGSFPAARAGRGGCRSNVSYVRYANAGLVHCVVGCGNIQGGPKKPHTVLLSISLLNFDR